MEIKKDIINPGDIITLDVSMAAVIDREEYETNKKGAKVKTVEYMIHDIYPHHVLCFRTTPPHDKLSLSYQQLYTMGIIKNTDFKKSFAR